VILTVGLVAPEPCCRKRSDQLPQGLAGLPDAPWGALSPVVDAAGGDPRDPERPGFAAGHGAFCQAAPQDAERAAWHPYRQAALVLNLPGAAGAARCG